MSEKDIETLTGSNDDGPSEGAQQTRDFRPGQILQVTVELDEGQDVVETLSVIQTATGGGRITSVSIYSQPSFF